VKCRMDLVQFYLEKFEELVEKFQMMKEIKYLIKF